MNDFTQISKIIYFLMSTLDDCKGNIKDINVSNVNHQTTSSYTLEDENITSPSVQFFTLYIAELIEWQDFLVKVEKVGLVYSVEVKIKTAKLEMEIPINSNELLIPTNLLQVIVDYLTSPEFEEILELIQLSITERIKLDEITAKDFIDGTDAAIRTLRKYQKQLPLFSSKTFGKQFTEKNLSDIELLIPVFKQWLVST